MKQNRNIGFDIARSAAILMVWICHSGFFSVGISYQFLSFAGVLCVDIFFVLSGLLVGRSLILAVTDEKPAKVLGKFYINRCIRTLPIYYGMLLVTAVVYHTQIPNSYFVFLQNFNDTDMGFLPQSWSLTIEAWFYFLVPPLFLALTKGLSGKLSKKKAVFIAIGILYAIPLVLRIFVVAKYNPTWDAGIRKQTYLRLDAVMTGVLFAAVKLYAKEIYYKIAQKHSTLVLSMGGILALYGFYCTYLLKDNNFDESAFWKVFVFSVLPLLCCLLVMYLENSKILENLSGTLFAKMICGFSTLGYGTYLTHFLIFEKVSQYFVGASFSVSWMGFLLAMALTTLVGAILYWLVEIPMTKLRNRIIAKL